MQDPYKSLGVARAATPDEIKNAYRALAKKFHPDLNPGNKEAEHKFKDINAAYEILGTPENRAKFDRGEWGMDEGTGTGAGGGQRRRAGPFYRDTQGSRYSYDFGEGFDESVFESLFGGRGKAGRDGFRVPGQDEAYRMEISLREAVLGGEREIQLPSGKRLAVRIPKGVFSGQKLRFTGQGGTGLGGGPPGDVYVELLLQADPRFALEGSALLHELSVPLDIAVLGGELPVPTPEGQVSLRIPPHSSSGRRLRIPGKGVFRKGDGARGDLLVVIRVALPDPMDAGLEQAVRDWKARREGRSP